MPDKVVIETFETQAHRIILKDDGIVFVYSKPSHITKEDVEKLFEKLAEINVHTERLTLIMDPTQENSMTTEAKKHVIDHFKTHVERVAIISRKRFVRTMFLFFRSIKDIGVEMKMFKNEEDAKEWISTIKDKNTTS